MVLIKQVEIRIDEDAFKNLIIKGGIHGNSGR